jgi:hypothetical protein
MTTLAGNTVDIAVLNRYRRAADYLAAAMIFLRDNVLLREPLRPEHLKPRLLGHWGNPARYVEVPSPRRPDALVWTPQRVEAWQQTGERPSVAVWTTEQAATFLSLVAKDRLAVMWWLIFLTCRFHHLVGESGLPPVRLHDLRHGVASLTHCAAVDHIRPTDVPQRSKGA